MSDAESRRPAMDTRTPSALGVGLMAAAGYPVWPNPARQALTPSAPMPVAAMSPVPAEEVQALLRRVESLLVDAPHWDEEARGTCVGLAQRVHDAARTVAVLD